MHTWLDDYKTLAERAGLVRLEAWSCIAVSGQDRAKLLHNLCTNDILGLQAGQGCEAFFTDLKAKILAHTLVLCRDEKILLLSPCQIRETLVAHLDRYVIREDVVLEPLDDLHVDLLAGAQSDAVLAALCQFDPQVLPAPCDSAELTFEGGEVTAVKTDWYGACGVLLLTPAARVDDVRRRLEAEGAQACDPLAAEAARIEAGTPFYGVDFDASNLPQEMARNDRAINLTKGCYLGQETVARIDALGHVNRLLAGVKLTGDEVPPAGTELTSADGQAVGKISSATYSPKIQAPLALAIVRRELSQPGSTVSAAGAPCEVVALPVTA